jgi:hypothetical protein
MVIGGGKWRSTFKLGNHWFVLNYSGCWQPLGLQKKKNYNKNLRYRECKLFLL